MRSAQILRLSRCVTPAGVLKRANIINVPDSGALMAKRVAAPSAGLTHYLTGEQQFGKAEPTFLGAAGKSVLGAGRTALSPLLGLVHAGGPGAGRQSGLGGAVTHGVDALGNLFSGNLRGAGEAVKQVGRDINPWNERGAWSKSIQRHAGKGFEDVTRQIPNWWNYPGGFWENWGNQARTSTNQYGKPGL